MEAIIHLSKEEKIKIFYILFDILYVIFWDVAIQILRVVMQLPGKIDLSSSCSPKEQICLWADARNSMIVLIKEYTAFAALQL